MPSTTYAFYSKSLQEELSPKPSPIKYAFGSAVLANIYRTGHASKEDVLKQNPIPDDAVYLGTIENGVLNRDQMPDILTRILG